MIWTSYLQYLFWKAIYNHTHLHHGNKKSNSIKRCMQCNLKVFEINLVLYTYQIKLFEKEILLRALNRSALGIPSFFRRTIYIYFLEFAWKCLRNLLQWFLGPGKLKKPTTKIVLQKYWYLKTGLVVELMISNK